MSLLPLFLDCYRAVSVVCNSIVIAADPIKLFANATHLRARLHCLNAAEFHQFKQ
jgi:hypothetical protein